MSSAWKRGNDMSRTTKTWTFLALLTAAAASSPATATPFNLSYGGRFADANGNAVAGRAGADVQRHDEEVGAVRPGRRHHRYRRRRVRQPLLYPGPGPRRPLRDGAAGLQRDDRGPLDPEGRGGQQRLPKLGRLGH